MRVWQGLGNLRVEGEEEKDAGLSGKGDQNTENVSRQEPSGPPVKATGTRKARPINRGKARRYKKRRWRREVAATAARGAIKAPRLHGGAEEQQDG